MLCNILTTILRPNFEEPLDTAKQLVEKNITINGQPRGNYWKQFLLESSTHEYKILGENMILADDWDHWYNVTEFGVIGNGTHTLMRGYLTPYLLTLGRWYRSKDKLAGDNPFGVYMANKKWHLNEVVCDPGICFS